MGYITFRLNPSTKKLTYEITDWVVKHCGKPSKSGAVYATDGYGFFCVPRSITQRLIDNNRIFDEADAWLDLWCHTVYRDYSNAFSFLAPAVQFGTCQCSGIHNMNPFRGRHQVSCAKGCLITAGETVANRKNQNLFFSVVYLFQHIANGRLRRRGGPPIFTFSRNSSLLIWV